MKKKNLTINKLALGNLKQRRKQYTILIIGIILAMIFSSGTLFFMFSSRETNMAQNHNKYGYQDGIFRTEGNIEEIFKTASDDGIVTDYGFAHVVGFGYTEEDSEIMGTAIAWLDDNAKRLSNQAFIEGGYPEKENEIAIEENALLRLGKDAKLGDEVTLQVKTQNGEGYLDTVEKTYKLVGIAVDKKSNIQGSGYSDNEMLPAAFVAQGTQTELGGKELLAAYVKGTDDYEEYITSPEGYQYDNDPFLNIEQYFIASSVYFLAADTHVNSNSWGYGYLSSIVSNANYYIVIVIVLIFASCMVIINSFNANLKERKKQIGLLRAVGATKRQIISIFGREAFIITLICTPVSIAISYGIVRIGISLVSDEAVFTKSIWVLALCAAVDIIVTTLAALIPLILASQITPMQAIRNIDLARKMKVKKIKTQKQFNVPAHLAKRNARLYHGGKIAVSVILTVTIFFSCFCYSLMADSGTFVYDSGNDYVLYGTDYYSYSDYNNDESPGYSEADKREIAELPYFSEISSKKKITTVLELDEISEFFLCFDKFRGYFEKDFEYAEYTREDFYTKIVDLSNKNYLANKNDYGNGKDVLPVMLYSYEDKDVKNLEKHLTAGKIDLDKLNSGEEIILVAPQRAKLGYAYYSDYDAIGYAAFYDGEPLYDDMTVFCEGNNPYSVGDKIKLSVIEFTGENEEFTKIEREITIGAIVSPDRYSTDEDFRFVTTLTGMNAFSETVKYHYISMTVDPNIKLDDEIDETITDFLQPLADRYSGWMKSEYKQNQERRESDASLYITMLSVIIFGFVICASIVNNTITASIRERKKEIGTLRAVGADISVLVKSYIRQLLSMFAFGYGIGFVFTVITFIILSKVQGWSMATFTPWETLVFCVILFAICSFNLWSKVRKEMKNSIVENIREL